MVLTGRAFSRETRDAVEALYPTHEKMDRVIEEDGKRFTDAMARAGLEPTLKLNGVEMTNALARHYEDDVDLGLARAELGLGKDEYGRSAVDADRNVKALLRRLEQGAIPREQFEQHYRELAVSLTDERVVPVAAAPAAKPAAAPAAYAPPKAAAPTSYAPALPVRRSQAAPY
jgi:hypothetical protein